MTTVAGDGTAGAVDGPGASARFDNPQGVAVDSSGMIYVADTGNNRIRRIAVDGTVATLAGGSTSGFQDGAGSQARFNAPQGVAVDASGVVYVADTGNHRIRRIAVDGTVSTLAGDGTTGFVNGAGAQARFNAPRGLAIDPTENVYVADSGNSAVRVIANGNVSTVAGDGSIGTSDSPVARFNGLAGVAVDGATLYIYAADTGNHRLRRLTPGGAVLTIAGADRGFADGSAASARFADPSGIAVDGAGKLVVADATNSLVRSVDAELALGGSLVAVSTIAGTGERGSTDGAGNVARFITPRGVAVSPSSAIIVADTGNQVVRRILLPPAITALNPAQAHTLDNVTITGERFDGRLPAGNTVRFTKTGGGQTAAEVVLASRTQLTVIVPADAVTGTVTVQTQGGTAVSPMSFTVLPPAPTITDFNPKHGPVGTAVMLTGTSLQTAGGATSVTFAGSGGTRLQALISTLGFAGGMNFYAYVGNSPLNATDPSGLYTAPYEIADWLDKWIDCLEQGLNTIPGMGVYNDVTEWWNSHFPRLRVGNPRELANLLRGLSDMLRLGTTFAEVSRNGEGFWGYAYAVARETKRAADLFLLLGSLGSAFVEARAAGAAAEAEGAGALGNANYAQKTFTQTFDREGRLAGRTVEDVAGALRSGKMSPGDVPIEYIVRDGNTLILNTRSAQALEQAGIPRAQWNIVNKTGDAAAEARLNVQLQRNGLDSRGIPTVKPGRP